MRLTTLLAVAALVFSASGALRADEGETSDIRTISGKSYSHCQVVRMYPDGVTFRHSKGMAKVLYTDMKPEVRKNFGYDSAKLEAFERKQREDRAKAREVAAARNAEVNKAWAEAYRQAAELEALTAFQNQGGNAGYGGYSGLVDFGLANMNAYGWGNQLGFNSAGFCANNHQAYYRTGSNGIGVGGNHCNGTAIGITSVYAPAPRSAPRNFVGTGHVAGGIR